MPSIFRFKIRTMAALLGVAGAAFVPVVSGAQPAAAAACSRSGAHTVKTVTAPNGTKVRLRYPGGGSDYCAWAWDSNMPAGYLAYDGSLYYNRVWIYSSSRGVTKSRNTRATSRTSPMYALAPDTERAHACYQRIVEHPNGRRVAVSAKTCTPYVWLCAWSCNLAAPTAASLAPQTAARLH